MMIYRRKIRCSFFITFLLFVFTLSCAAAAGEEITRVLLLHTLSPEDIWTQQATKGIRSAFADQQSSTEIYIQYMDVAGALRSDRPEQTMKLKKLIRAKLPPGSLDLIITTGNEAASFLLVNEEGLFEGVPIVFCELTNTSILSVFPRHRGTGVYSTSPVSLLLREIIRLHPGTPISLVADLTPAGLRDLAHFHNHLNSLSKRPEIVTLAGLSPEKVPLYRESLSRETVVVFGTCARTLSGAPILLGEMIEVFSSLSPSNPIYTIQEEGVSLGALGSVAGNAFLKGRRTGEIALRILGGESPASIQPELMDSNAMVFDFRKMSEFGITRSRLPRNSIVINDPADLLRKYGPIAALNIFVFTVLGGLAVFLRKKIARRKETEKDLLERSKYWETLFQHSPEGIIVYDSSGKIIEANTRFRSLFSLSREQLSSESLSSVLPWENGTLLRKDFFPEGKTPSKEAIIPNRNLVPLTTSFLPFSLSSGRETTFCALVHDISGRKAMESELSDRVLFQERLASVSTRFLLSQDYTGSIQYALETIRLLADAETASLFRIPGQNGTLLPEHEAIGPGPGPSLAEVITSTSEQDSFWKTLIFNEELHRHFSFIPGDITDPDFQKERDAFIKEGIRSLSVFPLFLKDSFHGFLALVNPSEKWFGNSEDILFDMVRDILSAALEQRTDEECLENNNRIMNERFAGAIRAMCQVSELRDVSTAGHQKSVSSIAESLAEILGMPEDIRKGVLFAGLVHDVGKLYIPAGILSKPTRLSAPEYELVKKHPEYGRDILSPLAFPWPLAEIVFQHHERMDGSGYPRGLHKEDIRIEARILSVADAYDAMTSERPYRKKKTSAEALAELQLLSETAYDPRIVKALEKYCSNKTAA